MNISVNNSISNSLNFKSTINIVDKFAFDKALGNCPRLKFVDAPWTPNEMIKSSGSVWTEEVKHCTAGGILLRDPEGLKKMLMFHFNPDAEGCMDLSKIKDAIMKKIGKLEPLQALMFGSKDAEWLSYSGSFFEDIRRIIKQNLQIPITSFKGTPTGGHQVDALYNVPTDTWTLTSTAKDKRPCDIGYTGFRETYLIESDKLNCN